MVPEGPPQPPPSHTLPHPSWRRSFRWCGPPACAYSQCLVSPQGGYTYLDVRSALEVEEVGKVSGSVNVPFMLVSREYDPETRTKEIKRDPNPDFVRQVCKDKHPKEKNETVSDHT